MDSNQGLSASPPHGSKEPHAGGSVLLIARTTMASSQARNSKLPSAERKLFSAKVLTQPVPNQLLAKSRFTGKSTRNISLLRFDPTHICCRVFWNHLNTLHVTSHIYLLTAVLTYPDISSNIYANIFAIISFVIWIRVNISCCAVWSLSWNIVWHIFLTNIVVFLWRFYFDMLSDITAAPSSHVFWHTLTFLIFRILTYCEHKVWHLASHFFWHQV